MSSQKIRIRRVYKPPGRKSPPQLSGLVTIYQLPLRAGSLLPASLVDIGMGSDHSNMSLLNSLKALTLPRLHYLLWLDIKLTFATHLQRMNPYVVSRFKLMFSENGFQFIYRRLYILYNFKNLFYKIFMTCVL